MRARAWLLLTVLVLVSSQTRAADTFRYPEGRHAKGELRYVAGIPVLTVTGTPDEMGEQIGTLAVRPAARQLERYLKGFLRDRGLERLWPVLVLSCDGMIARMPAHHRRELEAMAKSSQLDRGVLVVANTMLEVLKIGGCATVVVEPKRSGSGKLLFGRNFDFPALGVLHEFSLVTVYRPQGKRAFATVGFPGLIGSPSGINESGLCLAANEITEAADGSPRLNTKGVPMGSCWRSLLEQCATVQEAEEQLRATTRSTYVSLTMCDRKTGVVFEVTPNAVVPRRAQDGICLCTNHFRCQGLALSNRCNRYRSLERCQQQRTLSLQDVGKELHAVHQGEATVQTMIFEPEAGRLHLSLGKGPASARPLQPLELHKFLKP